ncbi:MAG: hypothetical protein RI973_1111 [Bacteroidota bacterium]|jgi:tetratricopeptide (TPR) repeat protein
MATKKEKQSSKPAAQPKQINSKIALFLAAIAGLLGVLLYLNTLGHGYVLDDFSFIKENFITRRGLAGIPDLWKHESRFGYWNNPGELYRPLPLTMFAIEWQLAPDQPWLGHLMNTLLYGLTGSLMFYTLSRWLRNYHFLVPFLTTLLFTAHPVHVEVVANIKSRDEILMLLLSLTALNLLWKYLDHKKPAFLVLSLLSYAGALFSKENAVTIMAIIPLAMYFFSNAKPSKIASTTALYLLPVLLMFMARRMAIGDALAAKEEFSILDNFLVGAEDNIGLRLAGAFLMLGKYLQALVFPYTLVSDLGYNQLPLPNWADWRVLMSFSFWIAAGALALLQLKRKSLWSFAILFFIINFSIFSNILVLIGTSYGERLLYAASPGFSLASALLLLKVFKVDISAAAKPASLAAVFGNKGLWAVTAAVLGLYSLKTITRNADWKDSYALYTADIENSPNSAKLNFHYGLEINQKGHKAENPEEQMAIYRQARATFEKAASIYPSYHDAYSQIGLAHYREKNNAKALENYELALKYNPRLALVYSNMGIIYFEQGDLNKAREVYEKAVQYDPRMKDALRNLAAVHAMQKNFPEAIKWFKQALSYWPDDATLNYFLYSVYRDSGQEDLGRPYLEKARQIDPKIGQ